MNNKILELSNEIVQLKVFPQLKVYRSLSWKDRYSACVYIPVVWLNGFNVKTVSLQLAQKESDGHTVVVVDLQDVPPMERKKELKKEVIK